MKSLYHTLKAAKDSGEVKDFNKVLARLIVAVTRDGDVETEGTGCNPACQEGYICDNGRCIRDIDLAPHVK